MDTRQGARILVVDDDPRELDQTLNAIRRHGVGYEARIARGGFEALDYVFGRGRFHERRRHPLPDLILLDFDMVPLNGLAVLRRIREADYLPRIPVVILCKSESERERAVRDGAGTCAVKPISTEDVNDLLLISGLGGHFLALPPIDHALSKDRARLDEEPLERSVARSLDAIVNSWRGPQPEKC